MAMSLAVAASQRLRELFISPQYCGTPAFEVHPHKPAASNDISRLKHGEAD
jgi:hypothetical protein